MADEFVRVEEAPPSGTAKHIDNWKLPTAGPGGEDLYRQITRTGGVAEDDLQNVTSGEAHTRDPVARTTLNARYGGAKTAVVATVTASGNTTIFTPTTGNYLDVYWVYAVTQPEATTTPLIKVSLGSTEIYRVYAVSHWEFFVGGINDPLVVNLSTTGSVAFTAHIQEVTP